MTGKDSPKAVESPPGEVPEDFLQNETPTNEKLLETSEKGVHRKRVKGSRKIVSRPVCQKIDFMSVKQATKLVNKIDSSMFLCLLQPKELPKEKKKENQCQSWCNKRANRGREAPGYCGLYIVFGLGLEYC